MRLPLFACAIGVLLAPALTAGCTALGVDGRCSADSQCPLGTSCGDGVCVQTTSFLPGDPDRGDADGPPDDEQPLVVDDFTRVDESGFGAPTYAENGEAWTCEGAAEFAVDGERGVFRWAKADGLASCTLGRIGVRDIDVRASVDIGEVRDGGELVVFLGARAAGGRHTGIELRTSGAAIVMRDRQADGATVISDDASAALAAAAPASLDLHLRITDGATGARIEASAWPTGAAEPASMMIDVVIDAASAEQAGDVVLGGSSLDAGQSLRWDAVTVDAL